MFSALSVVRVQSIHIKDTLFSKVVRKAIRRKPYINIYVTATALKFFHIIIKNQDFGTSLLN